MKARKVKKLDPAEPLRRSAARIVRTRLDELRSFAGAALEPGATTAQHDMRIAAKRLRYVLEIVEGCFGPDAVAARRVVKAASGRAPRHPRLRRDVAARRGHRSHPSPC